MALLLVEQAFGYEADVGSLCLPMGRLLGVELKRAVPYQLGIEAAIAGEVDVLVEDAVERRTDFDALLRHIDFDVDLCLQACESKSKQKKQTYSFLFHGCIVLI